MINGIMNADFYKYIPYWMRDQLQFLYGQYWHKEWFDEAFKTYRFVVLEDHKKNREPHMPGYVFNTYLKREFEVNKKLKSRPILLRQNFYQCRNCGKSFSIKSQKEMFNNCPNCGIDFLPSNF